MRKIAVLLICLYITGCTALKALDESVKGMQDYLMGGEDNTEPPHELVVYPPEIAIKLLWKHQIGVGFDEQYLKLVPALGYGKVVAVDREGLVQARNAKTGALSWSVETGLLISGGPGIGSETVIIGSSNAQIVALNINTGEELWRSQASSEVLSVPRVEQGVVLIRTSDGKELALRESTGETLWEFVKNVPALSIRGTGSPIVVDDNVISGYANGKMVALRLKDGRNVWETSIAIPKGRSEVERLVDLDVDPIESDGVIYVASYQGGVTAVMASDGDVLWRNEDISSYTGLSYDWRYLYLSDSESDVWQLDQRNGSVLWKQKDLHQRKLSAPVAYDNYVVVGDLEGYVHWLATSDGRQLGRLQITDDAIEAQPVVVDNIVYVYARDGTLAALKASPL